MNIDKFERPERPAYRVLDVAGFFGDNDTWYQEGSEIYYDGSPALEMEPLNEPARIKMQALLEELDNKGRAAAEKLGRPYTGLARNLDGAIAIATALQRQEMAVMGAQHKESTTAPVQASEAPDTGRRGRGRPKKLA